MKFWEKLSRSISEFAGRGIQQKLSDNSIELVLQRSRQVLDEEALCAIQEYMASQQTPQGGFADKAGRCDLYYTLFGCYATEALGMYEAIPAVKKYVQENVQPEKLAGVDLYCAAILYAKLFGSHRVPSAIFQKLTLLLDQSVEKTPVYTGFMSLLVLYALKDYRNLYRIRRHLAADTESMPCSVTAARLVLDFAFGKPSENMRKDLMNFYAQGGFRAVKNAPVSDLLSTAVALYALRFIHADLRMIKPDCLSFIDSLFIKGGFRATILDQAADVEYTFYGLLALGSLAD